MFLAVTKTIGWERRLVAYLHEAARRRFRPGTRDCYAMTLGAIEVITESKINDRYRGKYRSIKKGLALVRKDGFADHVEYIATLFPEHAGPLFAQRGDIAVALDEHGEPALGIVQGEHVYFMGPKGLGLAKLETAVKAFKV